MSNVLTTPKDVIKELGGAKKVSDLTGVKINAVVEWGRGGRIPSKMFLFSSAELARRGKYAPPAVFGMVEPDAAPVGAGE